MGFHLIADLFMVNVRHRDHVPFDSTRFHRLLKSSDDNSWLAYDMRWRNLRDAEAVSWGTPKTTRDSDDVVHGLHWINNTFALEPRPILSLRQVPHHTRLHTHPRRRHGMGSPPSITPPPPPPLPNLRQSTHPIDAEPPNLSLGLNLDYIKLAGELFEELEVWLSRGKEMGRWERVKVCTVGMMRLCPSSIDIAALDTVYPVQMAKAAGLVRALDVHMSRLGGAAAVLGREREKCPKLQNLLWNLRHSASDHVPGKLSLCIGMPVIIRNNDATELCITKGQEGHVVGWDAKLGLSGQRILETLFVKLDRPAKTIKIEGLPENVVPLVKNSMSIECICPSDVTLTISRSQVSVLPNFAMTDYASQGKTRPFNVVDLNSCRNHLSYYTALSRSATCEGTVIVQGFDPSKITCGASGYLRQEFRELELLDDITNLKYNGQLPPSINGQLRNALLRQYQQLKGKGYCPQNFMDTHHKINHLWVWASAAHGMYESFPWTSNAEKYVDNNV
ncbi:uncharacterized protein LACBIDRAFT_330779 [Laccaria bicolor S238N-H82]|uniref:Predicted protein n=1 Tax=Laccaria bicolor (strain S238N-H82 / ATCC MYA-4686) TaxID=486041 RepID=B0DMG0_LACBS|nr:uncharacterized protein LACBIDRAFT_330779 [Laccaria bicolor S238N-H82]EDR04280.1 predicted protein [Laccaria bicolor S238N-H82]|eukprot:XP_001885171.1 predicted protein [Laccaria bicolor S238N-H82]